MRFGAGVIIGALLVFLALHYWHECRAYFSVLTCLWHL